MLSLYVEAPFAAFRTFTAGSFRPTADFITPSAAYGLILNVAGIDMRRDDPKFPMTLIAADLPVIWIALAALSLPQRQSVYQQLHNYPIGNDAGEKYEAGTKGRKYNISPASRSFLSDIRAYICLDGNPVIEQLVREGLEGKRKRAYGLPFLGDNNFLLDRMDPVGDRHPAYWFEKITNDDDEGVRPGTTRLTVTINRADMAQSRSMLYAPSAQPSIDIPEKAWTEVRYA